MNCDCKPGEAYKRFADDVDRFLRATKRKNVCVEMAFRLLGYKLVENARELGLSEEQASIVTFDVVNAMVLGFNDAGLEVVSEIEQPESVPTGESVH